MNPARWNPAVSTPPWYVGLLVAAGLIAGEVAVVRLLRDPPPHSTYAIVFMFGVLIMSAGWGLSVSALTTLASAFAYLQVHLDGGPLLPLKPIDVLTLSVFLPIAGLANVLGWQLRARAQAAHQNWQEANAARAELVASRARIVTAADNARRAIERDLHDGAQQRLVTLALQVRTLQMAIPEDPAELRSRLAGIGDGLRTASDELRELAHGVHPAILSRGGLRPALRDLGRRAPLPVDVHVDVPVRLPQPVEIAAYYTVAEALTNAAKHAQASAVTVNVDTDVTSLRISVADDGVGGASLDAGSGLVGLEDRVTALGGTLHLSSAVGVGTTLIAEMPLDDAALAVGTDTG